MKMGKEETEANNESKRLAALREYDILDTAAEEELDALTKLASTVCDTPIALITIIDEHRQWFKSRIGIEGTETLREDAFCNEAIKGDDIYEVKNALDNSLFVNNPYVTGDPSIRFYAGAPLVTPGGYKLGALCVIDTVPKQLTEKQKETLRILAGFIIKHFELKKKKRELEESELRYSDLVQNVADIIYTADLNGNFTFVNQNVERSLGYKPEELIGKNFKDLIPAAEKELVAAFYRHQFSTGLKESTFEFPVLAKDGRIKWVEQNVSMIHDAHTVKGIQSIVRDITARKKAEQQLQEANSRVEEARNMLQSVLDNTSSIIFIKDIEHRYLLVNKQYETTYHLSLKDIYLKTDYTFRSKELADQMLSTDQQVFESGKPVTFEQEIILEGKKLVMLTTKVPLFNDKGELYALCGIATDISTQKEVQQMLEERDKRFSTLFLASPVAMTLASTNPSVLVESNKAFEELTGLANSDIIGKNSSEMGIISKEERERLLQLFKEKGSLKNYEMVINTKSGEKKDIMITSNIIEIEKQEFTLNVYLDITARKKNSLELMRIQKLLTEAMSIGRMGSFENNLLTREIIWSKEIYDIMEMPYEAKPFTYEEYINSVHPNDLDLVMQGIAKTLKDKQPDVTVNRFITAKGKVKYIETRIVPLLDATGEVYMFRGTMQDITEKKILENELREAKDIAEKSVIAKEHFLSNMSHEIRTPMNAVLGFTDLLLDTPLNEEQRDYLTTIQSSGKNLMAIINDILDYSKIEAGMMSIDKIPLSIRSTFSSLQVLFSQKKKEKNLELSFKADPAIPENLLGDPTRLTQIITNLVSNAIKFTEKGGVYVTAKLINDDGAVSTIHFTVRDTGIGISKEQQAAIFERFNQGENDTTRKYGGTGLGLSIVKRLVELQGGSISVSSKQGQGSLFEFTLPLQHYNGEEPVRSFTPGEVKTVQKTLHILLVEDNIINQKLAEKILYKFGYTVDIADNGKIALDKLGKSVYDVILMDMQMPEMDGYEAAVFIRKKLNITTPIIAMTAHAMSGEREKCLAIGMNDYISKPFKADELFEKINFLAGKSVTHATNEHAISHQPEPDTLLIDLSHLHELSDDDPVFIKEMLDLFVREIPAMIKQLKDAIDQDDYKEAEYMAHKLKSSIQMVGLSHILSPLLSEVEYLGKSQTGQAQLKDLYARIHEIFTRAIREAEVESNKLG